MVSKKVIKLTKAEPTMRMLAEEYLLDCEARGLKGNFSGTFENHFKFAMDYIDPDCCVSDVDYKRFYAAMYKRTDIAPNSIASYLRGFKCFINWINKNYAYSLPIPVIKVVDTVKEPYTDEELIKLITKPKEWKNFCEYRNWLIINFLIDTGIRAATLRAIRVEDINFENSSFVTRHNKTNRVQVLPFSAFLNKELKSYIRMRQASHDDFLFCDEFGNELSANGLKQAIRKYNLSRGVEKTSTHLFRHTFARKYLIDCEGDPLKLQKLLGHTTLAMTNHYTRIYNMDLINDAKSPLDTLRSNRHKIKA